VRNCELPGILHFSTSWSPGSPGHVSSRASETKFPQARPAPRIISTQPAFNGWTMPPPSLPSEINQFGHCQAMPGTLSAWQHCARLLCACSAVNRSSIKGWYFLRPIRLCLHPARRPRNCLTRPSMWYWWSTTRHQLSNPNRRQSNLIPLHRQLDRCTVQVTRMSPEACQAGLWLCFCFFWAICQGAPAGDPAPLQQSWVMLRTEPAASSNGQNIIWLRTVHPDFYLQRLGGWLGDLKCSLELNHSVIGAPTACPI
jgi:hypothetical protein